MAYANEDQKRLILKVLRAEVDKNASIKQSYYNFISYSGLSAGDIGYMGEYPFPTDLLKPTQIAVTYDGTNWKICKEYDQKENRCIESNPTSINNSFSANDPHVRYERDSYFLRPLLTTTRANGIMIWYNYRSAALSGDTSIPVIMEEFHELFAYLLAVRWGERNPEKANPKWEKKAEKLELEMQEFYKNRFKRSLQIKTKTSNYR